MLNEKLAKLLGVVLRVGVYALFVVAGMYLFGWLLAASGDYLLAAAVGGFLTAVVANALVMWIFERASLADIGLGWNRASIGNLLVGLAGGTGAACLVLVGPVVCRLAEFQAVAGAEPSGARCCL